MNEMDNDKSSLILEDELSKLTSEISQLKKALKETKASEEKHRLIIDSVTDMISTHAPDGRYSYLSSSCTSILGYRPEELIGLDPYNFIHPEDINLVRKSHDTILSSPGIYISTYRTRRKNDTYVWFETSNRAVRDNETGKIIEIICVSRNITERKNAEDSLRETKRRLVTAQKIAHVGNWELNIKTNMTWASTEAFNIYGIERNSPYLPFDYVQESALPEYRNKLNDVLASLIIGKNKYDEVFKIKRLSDGQVRIVTSQAELESDAHGRPFRVLGVVRDITEQKQTEQSLLDSEAKRNAMIANISDVIEIMDANGIIQYKSPNSEKWFGWRHEDLVGTNGWDTIHPDDLERIQIEFSNLLQVDNAVNTVEYRYKCKDGSYKPIELTAVNLVNDPIIKGVLFNYHDITKRKMDETYLRETTRFLQESQVALRQSLSLLTATLESTADGILAVNRMGIITYFNDLFKKMWDIPDSIGPLIKDKIILQYVLDKLVDPQGFISKVNEIYNNPEDIFFDEIKLKNGNTYERYSIPQILDGQAVGRVWSFRDITHHKKHEQEILYLSYHDSLTGLHNRRYLDDQMIILDNLENLPISVIIGDVNGLKLANDTFGHQIGDLILQKIAGIIKDACQPSDIIARWGGDEFIILLPKTGFDETRKIISIMNEACIDTHVNSIAVSISFGFDIKTSISDDIDITLKNAEDYMYKHKTVETTSMRGRTIGMMLNTLYEKNVREEQHSRRVSELCVDIGNVMGLPEDVISKLKAIGLVHDIGKIAINDDVLNKPGKLTIKEFMEIKRHSAVGYRILNANNEMSEIAEHVLMHHERLDGSGYPNGLKDDEIPLITRILAVADSYDAMTSESTYRASMTREEATIELRKSSGTQFDAEVVQILLEKVL